MVVCVCTWYAFHEMPLASNSPTMHVLDMLNMSLETPNVVPATHVTPLVL